MFPTEPERGLVATRSSPGEHAQAAVAATGCTPSKGRRSTRTRCAPSWAISLLQACVDNTVIALGSDRRGACARAIPISTRAAGYHRALRPAAYDPRPARPWLACICAAFIGSGRRSGFPRCMYRAYFALITSLALVVPDFEEFDGLAGERRDSLLGRLSVGPYSPPGPAEHPPAMRLSNACAKHVQAARLAVRRCESNSSRRTRCATRPR